MRYAWVMVLGLWATAGAAFAGSLIPVRLYNGVNRPFYITVQTPGRPTDKLTIRWFDPQPEPPAVWATAEVRNGRVDLAEAFPGIWKRAHRTGYLQLFMGDRPVGSPLVMQPMTNPAVSRLAADGKSVEFVPDEDQAFAGYRAYEAKTLVIETSMGTMEFALRPDCAPNTAFNIMQMVEGGLYTNTIWHRVVAKRPDGNPFVIQGGDPAGSGSGGPGWAYPLEDSPLPHDFGVISIARSTDPNTNGCQWFVCLSRAGTQHLDHRYASFGQMVKGADVLRRIAAAPVGKDDRPNDPPAIRRAYLRPAPALGTGPRPLKS